jgi:glycosyltransferase involved in cell wall biosynthesis
MIGNGPNPKVVLSPVPLAHDLRAAHAPGAAVFLDLAALRRGGVGGAWRILRSQRASGVVVAGEHADLAVFHDLLAILALAVRAPRRWYAPRGLDPQPLRLRILPLALARIGFGVLAGFAALAAGILRLRRVEGSAAPGAAAQAPLRRCLYLKPALNFGTPVGGAVGHVAGVANALRRSGLEVRLAAVAAQPMVSSDVLQINVAPPSSAAYPNELNLYRYHRIYSRAALRLAAEFRPDFVYQRYSLNDLTGVLLRRRLGIPLILEFNGSETWIQRHWGNPLRFQRTSERIERANLRRADLVVTVSEEIRKQVLSLGVPERRVLFYPNCVDAAVFDPARFDQVRRLEVRRVLGLPPDADLFTFVGTFGQWHGTELLAAAIRELAGRDRAFLETRRIHFLLVGDGQAGEKVRSILEGIPFASLPGFRPQGETPAILAASDVCLSPHVPNADGTPFFGSPTKLFEYMAMAKPIVASDLDQIGRVLRGWRPGTPGQGPGGGPPQAALLVRPGDRESLIAGIRAAAEMDAASRSRLGQRARELVLASYTWDQNVREVLNRFRQIIGT